LRLGKALAILGLLVWGHAGFCAEREHPEDRAQAYVESFVPKATLESASSVKSEVKAGVGVREGDCLVTGAHGRVSLRLLDGSRMYLMRNSECTFRETGTKSGNRLFDLLRGVLAASVAPLTRGSSFRIQTPAAVVCVKGTQYRVEADGKATEVRVLRGVVQLEPIHGPGEDVGAGMVARAYPDRVEGLRRLERDEVEELRRDFQEEVREAQREYLLKTREAQKMQR